MKFKDKVKNFLNRHQTLIIIFGLCTFSGAIGLMVGCDIGRDAERKEMNEYIREREKYFLEKLRKKDDNVTKLSVSDVDPFYLLLSKKPYEYADTYEGFVEQMYDNDLLVLSGTNAPIVDKDSKEIIAEGIAFKLKELRSGAKDDLCAILHDGNGGYKTEYDGLEALM